MGAPSHPSRGGNYVPELGTVVADKGTNEPGPAERTLTSLVQQYLDVYLLENATFYAERLVATSLTNHSLYMLAFCYYREGKPQRSRCILEQAADPSPAMLYLLAKCFLDLKDYGAAEEALLKRCRREFQSYRMEQSMPQASNLSSMDAMNEYILKTSPCPIPNGAAGLSLLGTICRHSNRKQRAIQYYRMSLQLDPMMWMSFVALCDLGVSEKELDPATIFGIQAPMAGGTNSDQDGDGANGTPFSPLNDKTVMQPMDVATPMTESHSNSYMPKTSLFHASTTSENDAPSKNSTMMTLSATKPSASLFQTPNLTPIHMQEDTSQLVGAGAADGGVVGLSTAGRVPMSAIRSANPHVIRRARTVASRRYYEPSPELTPILGEAAEASHRSKAHPRSLFLSGLDDSSSSSHAAARGFETGGYGTDGDSCAGEEMTAPLDASHEDYDSIRLRNETPPQNRAANHGGEGGGDLAMKATASRKSRRLLSFGVPTESRTPLVGNHQRTDAHNQLGATAKADVGCSQSTEDYPVSNGDKGVREILELLYIMGAAQLNLGQFRSKEAIALFNMLPPHHLQTGYVMNQIGRAYFEMADYPSAIRYLQTMERLEPHRMVGLEFLSTALWQMKRHVELAQLAQRVTEFDRHSREVWCVVGNCFSLEKDHETALAFFRRSIQLDPSFTYSHTLSGHEYFANEDFEKAIECFRNAIRADERHYNAWYGLGAIYHCQEKYDLAEYHFTKACQINPQSTVLICYLGMAQNSNGKSYAALETLQSAFRMDPRNPQAHYQRALVFQSLDRHEEALAEFERVRDAAPREAHVYFSMGRLYKRMGKADKAMRCFLNALDLDPKDSSLIKAAMEKMDEPDIEEEQSTF